MGKPKHDLRDRVQRAFVSSDERSQGRAIALGGVVCSHVAMGGPSLAAAAGRHDRGLLLPRARHLRRFPRLQPRNGWRVTISTGFSSASSSICMLDRYRPATAGATWLYISG